VLAPFHARFLDVGPNIGGCAVFAGSVPVRCPLAGKQNARQDHGICRYERWRPFENDGTWESVRVDTNGWRVDFARRNAKFWTN
jgi:hypothetical protein